MLEHYDRHLELLSVAPSPEKHPDVPSCCPDWNYEQGGAVGLIGTKYKAGHGESSPRPGIEHGEELGQLQVRGFRIDTVREAIGPLRNPYGADLDAGESGQVLLKWDAECLRVSRRAAPQEDRVAERHARVLISDCLESKRCRDDPSAIYRDWKHAVALQSLDGPPELEDQRNLAAVRYTYAVLGAGEDRKFFSTRGGRVGMGPTQLEPDDVACVLYGGGPVFVLRFPDSDDVGKDQNALARLVGDAYVDGIMDGEALSAPDRGADQWFTLV